MNSWFQSLFCWKSVWEKARQRFLTTGIFVSILVLLEIGLGVALLSAAREIEPEFQSLFCWKSVWEFFFFFNLCFFLLVSILVLLEIGLGGKLPRVIDSEFLCFNPCFVGNRSGSLAMSFCSTPSLKFQSLFCWKSVWEAAPFKLFAFNGGFQSLFCWKSVWEKYSGRPAADVTAFQSLFCWKSVWEIDSAKASTSVSSCFNPCFVGNRSGSETLRGSGTIKDSFNPCFVGNRSGRQRLDGDVCGIYLVSILVLLEIGLGAGFWERGGSAKPSFNPCFVEIGRAHV